MREAAGDGQGWAGVWTVPPTPSSPSGLAHTSPGTQLLGAFGMWGDPLLPLPPPKKKHRPVFGKKTLSFAEI